MASRTGSSIRQGEHQLAQKLTTSFFLPWKSASETVRPSSAVSEKAGADLPVRCGDSESAWCPISRAFARQVMNTVKTASSTRARRPRTVSESAMEVRATLVGGLACRNQFVDLAALHDEGDSPHRGDVFERVAV